MLPASDFSVVFVFVLKRPYKTCAAGRRPCVIVQKAKCSHTCELLSIVANSGLHMERRRGGACDNGIVVLRT